MIIENETGGFQDIQQVLRRFGKTGDVARGKYREFIEAGTVEKSDSDFLSGVRANRELGFPTRETGNFLGIQQAAVSGAARQGAIVAEKRRIVWE